MLDKAIAHGKEFRKPYYKACERIDRSCRNHGSCPYCRDNRLHKFSKNLYSAGEDKKEISTLLP